MTRKLAAENDLPPTKDELISRLITEIQHLRDTVEATFSAGSEEAISAKKNLAEAEAIIATDRDLEQAYYQVALVRYALAQKQGSRSWSLKWPLFLLLYALIWLALFVLGYLYREQLGTRIGETSYAVTSIRAAWLSALAGGIGGALRIPVDLFRQTLIQKIFEPRKIMYFIVQPVMGFILGALTYFIVMAGFLVIDLTISEGSAEAQAELWRTILIALQVVLGLIAGFWHRWVLTMIDKIVQRMSGKSPANEEGESSQVILPIPPSEQSEGVQNE